MMMMMMMMIMMIIIIMKRVTRRKSHGAYVHVCTRVYTCVRHIIFKIQTNKCVRYLGLFCSVCVPGKIDTHTGVGIGNVPVMR